MIRHTWNRKTIRKVRVGQGTIVRRRSYRLDGKQTTKGGEGSTLLPVDGVATSFSTRGNLRRLIVARTWSSGDDGESRLVLESPAIARDESKVRRAGAGVGVEGVGTKWLGDELKRERRGILEREFEEIF
jgi:hypothetical protein